jgi:hypothetical protein
VASLYDPVALGLQVAKVSGDEALCFCPYHNDAHRSAAFNMKSGLFFFVMVV